MGGDDPSFIELVCTSHDHIPTLLKCAKEAAAPTMNMISAELCLVFNEV